jgi:hypothetical protein
MSETKKGPVYTGMTLHPHKQGGFAVWCQALAQREAQTRTYGMLFSPYPDDNNTSLLLEKHK